MKHWTLVEADPQERAAFADLHAVCALDGQPAAPANRFREVRRLVLAGRTYYLKAFGHTQRKNRWRNRWTQPNCRLDAEREHGVARALRERGFTVARTVAVGADGGASYYLCAGLPGVSLRTLLERGERDGGLARRAAEFCGAIAKAGVVLPDLSCEHVFVLDDPAADDCAREHRFAVIDLHNGSLRTRPSTRAARRIIRHFRRSIRDLPVAPALQLRFAVRLLRASGLSPRRILATLPPLDTHRRYDAPGKASAYADRNPSRTERELALLRRVWPGERGDVVVDAPCGAGRLARPITALGARWIGADRSAGMLAQAARVQPDARLICADAAHLPLRDGAVDGAVVFRFLHHLDPTAARAVVTEAARVARRYVVVSFFHPVSTHGLSRQLTSWGKPRTRHSLAPGRLRRWLAAEGFALRRLCGERPYLREFWIGVFEKRTDQA